MSWLELSVSADNEAVESISEVLARYGYNGGVVVEPAWTPGSEGPEFSYDVTRPSILRTYLPADEQAEDTRRRIEEALWHLGTMRPIGQLQVRAVNEEDWANAWKKYYTIQRIGERTVIVPSWLEYDAKPGDIVLRLDPGMAFGTGLHPTTQLCLRLLERYVTPKQDILDLGTGSGILAIAAAQLEPTSVLAMDNDPIAVEATQQNVERNNLTEHVQVVLGSLGAGKQLEHWLSGDIHTLVVPEPQVPQQPATQTFGLIVANLIAKVIILLASDMAAALRPDGMLITSGIILDREQEVHPALEAVGLELVERQQEGEWVALVHRHRK